MQSQKSKIITFYSYKGGVGRTMALANVAYLLANNYHYNVLVVDWDLEAPGLHRFFNIDEKEIEKGLIDLFYDYKNLLLKEAPTLRGDYLFCWDEISGNDNDILVQFLMKNYGINWLNDSKISIKEDSTILCTSKSSNNYLSLQLNNERTKAILTIDNVRSDEFIVNVEDNKLNIYGEEFLNIGNYIKKIPEYLFTWDEIPGQDNVKLIDFLIQKFGINWITKGKIEKTDNGSIIKVSSGINHLSLKLNDEKTIVNLKINDVRTYDFIAEMEKGKLYISNNEGSISLLSAGKQDDLYSERVNNFDWGKFYENWNGFGFVEYLKRQMRKKADFILIDSRTGVTDASGICTLQLPDVLVLLFSLNEQNISGTEKIINSVLKNKSEVKGKAPGFIIVPSRVDKFAEIEKREYWEKEAAQRLGRYLKYPSEKESPISYFTNRSIPYMSYYSFGEELAVKKSPHNEDIIGSFKFITEMVLKESSFLLHNSPSHKYIFSNRNMITNPDEFFGRENELRILFGRLANLQSCDVYGERKIGKSSLLYYIFKTAQERLGDDYVVAYIDMQDAKNHNVESFLRNSLNELSCNSDDIISSNSLNQNLIAFSESIKELKMKKNPILLIDEFERLAKKREFNNDVFDTLRSLGNNGDIAYVTASLNSLKTLCEMGQFTSPFYNIFSEVRLVKFTPDETNIFLSIRSESFGFNEREIEFISEVANHHPLHLQIACYHVFENRGNEWGEPKLRNIIEKEIIFFNNKVLLKKHALGVSAGLNSPVTIAAFASFLFLSLLEKYEISYKPMISVSFGILIFSIVYIIKYIKK